MKHNLNMKKLIAETKKEKIHLRIKLVSGAILYECCIAYEYIESKKQLKMRKALTRGWTAWKGMVDSVEVLRVDDS
ncbi:hypothetical protein [Paracoccus yeei]|uniref:hypothetical protein n=1 Tax=Paracoccus yeei TaxID=147645 RepID=UPI003BF84011